MKWLLVCFYTPVVESLVSSSSSCSSLLLLLLIQKGSCGIEVITVVVSSGLVIFYTAEKRGGGKWSMFIWMIIYIMWRNQWRPGRSALLCIHPPKRVMNSSLLEIRCSQSQSYLLFIIFFHSSSFFLLLYTPSSLWLDLLLFPSNPTWWQNH